MKLVDKVINDKLMSCMFNLQLLWIVVPGVQIFCILTFIDKCSAAQLREAVRNTEETLNISTIRIFQISNYTSAELGRDLTTLPNLRKEEALLQAFHTMVQEAYTPYFQSSGKK